MFLRLNQEQIEKRLQTHQIPNVKQDLKLLEAVVIRGSLKISFEEEKSVEIKPDS